MKMKTTSLNLLLFLFLNLHALPLFSQYGDGIMVLNEGGAGSNNSSVSFISNNAITNDIYGTANPSAGTLGDTGQSMAFNADYAYVVLNISSTIKVVNKSTFQLVATIATGLNNPRYMAFANGKAFVTNWGSGASATDDFLAVIDLTTNTVETTIPLAEGVERIQVINDKLYIAHQGGYGYGNTISVVNPVTYVVEQIIPVGDVPHSMLVNNGYLYVLCGGKPSWSGSETSGSLVKIDYNNNNTVVNTIPMPSQHPLHIKGTATGNDFYYSIDEKVYQGDLTSATLPTTPIFSLAAQGVYGIYGMDLIDDKLYVADAGNYVSPGTVYIYSTVGLLLENYTAAVIPNSFYKVETTLGTPMYNNVALNINMYPNPAENVFYLNTDKAATVKLYDATGRLVKQVAYLKQGVAVTDLNSGIYMVEITSEGAKSIQRLLVK